ncbi:MAG: hypothetical protein P8I88_05465, partial [Candidatus Thioglobus sp.]|nr:hypothetical protein [Candidatus Thioglobus sp.]
SAQLAPTAPAPTTVTFVLLDDIFKICFVFFNSLQIYALQCILHSLKKFLNSIEINNQEAFNFQHCNISGTIIVLVLIP